MQHKSFEGPQRKHNSKLRAACWINQQVRSVNEDSFLLMKEVGGESPSGQSTLGNIRFLSFVGKF